MQRQTSLCEIVFLPLITCVCPVQILALQTGLWWRRRCPRLLSSPVTSTSSQLWARVSWRTASPSSWRRPWSSITSASSPSRCTWSMRWVKFLYYRMAPSDEHLVFEWICCELGLLKEFCCLMHMHERLPFCCVTSLFLFYFLQFLMSGWATGYTYQCDLVDYSHSPLAMRVSSFSSFWISCLVIWIWLGS